MSSNDERPAKAGTVKPVIDWRKGADLLAQGLSVTEAARQIGCTRKQLSRRRNHDSIFQDWIREFADASSQESEGDIQGEDRLESLCGRLHDAIDAEVRNGNVRVILWLADRLKLIRPPEEKKQASPLEELILGMSEEEFKEFESLK